MMKAVVVVILGLSAVIQSCHPSDTAGVKESRPSWQANNEETVELCKILQEADEYDGKVIKLRTWLHNITGPTSVGDERCIQRHPLVDLEFEADFVERVCEPNNGTPELCTLAQEHAEVEMGSKWEILGVYKGLFESYKSDTGFTKNGLRFRFTIREALEIESVREVNVEAISH